MASVKSSLQFDISAKDNATSVLGKVSGQLDAVNASYERTKRVIEAAFVGISVTSVVDQFMSMNEQIDQIGKAAQKIGIPVEELSKLKYAAELADVPFDVLQSSIERFDKGLSQAAATGKGPVAAAFNDMGIAIRDAGGHVKDVDTLLKETADSFATHADGANKDALALALWGKAGAAMITVMNEGSKGIEEAGKQLDNFGGNVTPQAAESAKRLEDMFKGLKMEFYAVSMQAVILIDNALNPLAGSIIDLANSKSEIQSWGNYFKGALIDINEELIRDAGTIQVLGAAWSALNNEKAFNDGTVWKTFKTDMDAINASVETQVAQIENLRKGRQALDRDHQASIGSVTTLNVPLPDFKALDPLAVHTKHVDKLAEEVKRLIESTRTPWEKYQEQLAKINNLATEGKLDTDLYNRAITQAGFAYLKAADAADKHAAAIQKSKVYTDQLASSFDTWISDAVDGTFNLTDSLTKLLASFEKLALNSIFQELMNGSGGGGLYGNGGGISGIIGGIFGGIFGGARAAGGPVNAGSTYLVGERGPELFTAGASGAITPNSGSGGTVVNLNVDARGADAGRISALEATLKATIISLPKTIVGVVSREKASSPRFAT